MRDVDLIPDYLVAGLFSEEELTKKTSKLPVADPTSKIQKVEIKGSTYLVKSAKKIKGRK